MDLHYSKEYLNFEKEVKAFCKKYDGVTFTDASKNPLASSSSKKKKIQVTRSEWQKILIEQGYFARAVPKEYGGYGGEPDILKSRIIATEFSKQKHLLQWGVKG